MTASLCRNRLPDKGMGRFWLAGVRLARILKKSTLVNVRREKAVVFRG